jgi:hypothetical protein
VTRPLECSRAATAGCPTGDQKRRRGASQQCPERDWLAAAGWHLGGLEPLSIHALRILHIRMRDQFLILPRE